MFQEKYTKKVTLFALFTNGFINIQVLTLLNVNFDQSDSHCMGTILYRKLSVDVVLFIRVVIFLTKANNKKNSQEYKIHPLFTRKASNLVSKLFI